MSKFNNTYNTIINQHSEIIEEDFKKLLAGSLVAGSLLGGAFTADGACHDSKYHPKDSNRIQLGQLQADIDSNNRQQIRQMDQKTLREQTFRIAVPLIKQFQGTVRDRHGNHIVYDDLNSKRTWNPKRETLQQFDQRAKGRPTIGYGIIDKSVVAKGKITQSQAVQLLLNHMNKVYNQMRNYITPEIFAQLNPNQRAAMLSLYYNFGTNFKKTPLLLNAVDQQDWITAARNFLDCNNITKNGKLVTSPGLTIRRQKQADLFTKPYFKGK